MSLLLLRKIKNDDFTKSMSLFKLDQKVISNIFSKFGKSVKKWPEFIDRSFLTGETKEDYKKLIKERAKRLAIADN